MIGTVAKTIEEARAEVSGALSAIVMEYVVTYNRLADRAKQSDFREEEWDALAALIAKDEFERVGAQQEVMDWPAYRARLTAFAKTVDWKGTFRRIHEVDGGVYLELIEELRRGDEVETVNSVTVYDFDCNNKLRRLNVYLQKPVGGNIAVYSKPD